MKLANWNLQRAATKMKRTALREQTDAVAADLWILTETREEFDPGLPYSCHSAEWRDGLPGLDTAADHWVAIHSVHPLERIDVRDKVRTTAARVHPEDAAPFLVFGTVLPWNGDNWRGHASAGGDAFRAALKLQQQDWQDMRQDYPKDEFFVMGDMNQDLAPARYYGSKANKDALLAALDSVGLHALTGGDGDPIRRDSASYACIDHICALKDSLWKAEPAARWPDAPQPDKRLSDHFGVSVSLASKVI